MRAFEKTFAAALLCGAVSFALPSQAQTANAGTTSQGSSSSSTNATAEKPKAEATEAKKIVKKTVRRSEISPKENMETADLNKQSLQAVESGTTPTFTEPAPANKQIAEQGKNAGKTVVKKRVRRTRVNEKKPTG